MVKLKNLFVFSCFSLAFCTTADAWEANIPLAGNASVHGRFFIAEKSPKKLHRIFAANEPALEESLDCIHGRVEGDKQKQGDLKTPEGVYFITHKIKQELDFMEYGPHAFALNYPNPVDRIRKKTGSGIWLHSKGQPIAPIKTRGCLAIEKEDIQRILPLIKRATPIIVAETWKSDGEKPEGEGEILRQTELWIKQKAKRDPLRVKLYDKELYPIGNKESHSALVSRLESEKGRKKSVEEHKISVFEGPGYFVSCFDDPCDNAKKTALYWMQDSKGKYAIVGEVALTK